ncbi:HAD domain-containing protein [Nocardia sp. alder85J]|uniref:HAD domain-containing protein n=1 Tax=Nocardia sp. alder85J TaxID=2862949 RepID=UPI001CD343EC|nr:HAD domain-containing protein [Nocardia sp. alder85J]MCX4090931.1 HAD domain-containing protein [Nocardia sp. alder85J]
MSEARIESGRAAILLDVDGVLNPLHTGKPSPTHISHLLRPKIFPGLPAAVVHVWLDPDHGRQLRELAEATGAELVWATAWEHEAARLVAPILGLPSMAAITFGVHGTHRQDGHHGKTVAVTRWAGDRPICWFDDDFVAADHDWAARRTADGAPTLLIPVEPDIGLRAEHPARARAFLLA